MRATCEKLCFSALTGTALAEMLLHSCSAVTKATQDICLFCGGVILFLKKIVNYLQTQVDFG